MARRVKLVDTNEYSTNDVAYKAADGKYYSSEAAYKHILDQRECRMQCILFVMNKLGYEEGMLLPTVFNKKLKEFERYGYDVVFNTMISQESSIAWALNNKDFKDENGKIFYIMAIVQNNIMDEYKKATREYMRKAAFSNTNYEPVVEEIVVSNNKKARNISKFLEDED